MRDQSWMKKVVGILFVFCMLLLFIKWMPWKNVEVVTEDSRERAQFEVAFLEVGKADAILLFTQNSTVVIDTGEDGDGKAIVDYLKREKKTVIDCLILTHFDKDHVGGADTVMEELEIKQIYQTNTKKKSLDYEEYQEAVAVGKENVVTVETITDFTLDGVHYRIYPPADQYEKKKSNNSSLIVSATHDKNSFLFMGDAMKERIEEYLSYEETVYDVVKMPYHGRYLENMASFLDATKPTYAVVTSSGEDLEDARTMQELEKRKVEVLLTREGTKRIASDGTTVYLVK